MHHIPEVVHEPWTRFFADCDLFQSRVWLAESGAVLVPPADIEGRPAPVQTERLSAFTGACPESVAAVDGVDTADRRELKAALARIVEELQRTGPDDHVIGYAPGGFEVPLHVGVGHELD